MFTTAAAARPLLSAARSAGIRQTIARRGYRIDPADIERHANPGKAWIGVLGATSVVTYGLCQMIKVAQGPGKK